MGECTFAMLVPGVLLFICYFAPGYTFSSNVSEPYRDPELKWKALSRALVEETPEVNPRGYSGSGYSGSGYAPLPDVVRVPATAVYKSLLSPELVARAVPVEVMGILHPSPSIGGDPASLDHLLKVVCYVDRIYVKVSRSLFTSRWAHRYLTLGRCRVNQGDSDFYYFFYRLSRRRCRFSEMLMADYLSVITTLRYNPLGPVLWELPFTVTIECKFHRFHHVYSTGIEPILQGGTIPKDLTSLLNTGAQIILKDSSGTELTGPQTYTLGETMYFEARLLEGLDPNQRLYVNRCYMTASEDSSSIPQYMVIDKLGCMLAGRISFENKFLTATSKSSVNFAISALIFQELIGPAPGQEFMLYMHCEIADGPDIATTTRKSCNYVNSIPRWTELYDQDAVCTCCSSQLSCGSFARASNTLYTSTALVVDTHDLEPTSKF